MDMNAWRIYPPWTIGAVAHRSKSHGRSGRLARRGAGPDGVMAPNLGNPPGNIGGLPRSALSAGPLTVASISPVIGGHRGVPHGRSVTGGMAAGDVAGTAWLRPAGPAGLPPPGGPGCAAPLSRW